MAKQSSPERRLFDLWLGLRLFTAAWAIPWSHFRALTAREQTIAIWPPSQPFAAWLERVIFAPWERWDAIHFVSIVRDGYSAGNGTATFHPLLPMLSVPFAWLVREPVVALWIIASLATVLALIALYRLARLDLPPASAELACIIFIAFPVSAILFAPYTESLWILFAVLTLLWSRQGRWLAAGTAAAGAVLTRQQGILLLIPMAWELWERKRLDPRNWRGFAALLMPPLAYAGWILYRALGLADARADFSSFHNLIYSTVLSPSSSKIVTDQAMLFPWEALARALSNTSNYSSLNNWLNLGFGFLFLVLTAFAWRWMRMSYRLFTAAVILISFALHTGPVMPYMGLPRHLLLAFPVFIGLAPVLEPGPRRAIVAAIFLPLFLFVEFIYVLSAWVP
jgi:hypothetical protein